MAASYAPLGAFNRSGLNNSKGWLIGWQPTPIPPPGDAGNRKPEQPGEWVCVSCTLRNLKAAQACSACGTWKYSRGQPHASRFTG